LVGETGVSPLAPLHPERLIAVGESQSAIYLTTYIDAVQPVAHIFDGFLVHSRSGGAIPIAGSSLSGNMMSGGVKIRTDIGVPVLVLATETDEAFGHYYDARQPDSRYFRLWDIAGASHADVYLFGTAGAKALGCTSYNDAPSHFVIAASLPALSRWVETGTPPPSAPRLDVTVVNGAPEVRHDELGIGIGGIEGPWVRVPISASSGTPAPGSPGGCFLFGSTQPFAQAELASLYETKSAYLEKYANATDQAINDGYVLPGDRQAVLAYADQVRF
jgi:Alpha/beta hydrolase domain